MAALNFGSTLLQTGSEEDGGLAEEGLAALRRALQADDSEGVEGPLEAPADGGGRRLFDRAFAHALAPGLAAALMVPEAERSRWAPRAALGDMLRHALVSAEDGGGDGDDGRLALAAAAAPPARPLRAAEVALWFSCVDAERGGALVSFAEYRRGVEALRARLAAIEGPGGRAAAARGLLRGGAASVPPPPPPPPGGRAGARHAGRVRTDVTRGAGEGTSMATAFGEMVARHAR